MPDFRILGKQFMTAMPDATGDRSGREAASGSVVPASADLAAATV